MDIASTMYITPLSVINGAKPRTNPNCKKLDSPNIIAYMLNTFDPTIGP